MSSDFISLDLERVKEIIKDRLNVEPYNAGICTEYKGSITIFNDRINSVKNNNFYALVPKSYRRSDVEHKWVYDMSDFQIYCITKEYLKLSDISTDNRDLNKTTSIKLNDKLLVYCSKNGVIKPEPIVQTTLNAREIACLYLKIPKSGTDWLDSLIEETTKKSNII